MKYRFAEARKYWNACAQKEHKITNYEAFKEECRQRVAETGHRSIEMKAHESKSGNPIVIDF